MQLEFFDVPSPCIGVCQSNVKGYCHGCMRSRDERQNWQYFDNDKKQKVIKLCMQRQKRKQNKDSAASNANKNSQEHEQQSITLQPSLLDPPSKLKVVDNDDLDFADFEL